jgi:hypothetical protein
VIFFAKKNMAVLQIMLIALVGTASACTTNTRRGGKGAMLTKPAVNGEPQLPIESGSVDIPIRLQFQQGPIPSASFSVGLESKMNQNVGNGKYKQTQFNSGFELQGAAVPVLDSKNNIQGISADLDTHMEHNNKVLILEKDPMPLAKTPEGAEIVAAKPIQRVDSAEPVVVGVAAIEQPVVMSQKPLREFKVAAAQDATNDNHHQHHPAIAGLKIEYFVAIMCVSSACFLVLAVVMVIVAKKKQNVVAQVESRNARRNQAPVFGPVYAPESVSNPKPPSYSADSDYEKNKF